MLDTMRFEADDVGYSDLGEDEIEIEVRATGLKSVLPFWEMNDPC